MNKKTSTARRVEWTLTYCPWNPFTFRITHENDGPDEWRGYTEHHWGIFGMLGLVVRVPLNNWKPKNPAEYKAAREAAKARMLAQFLVHDGVCSSLGHAEEAIAARNAERGAAAA